MMHFKKIKLLVAGVLVGCSVYAQDPNILLSMEQPTFGVALKINYPGYTGGWARGYWLLNETGANSHFGIGGFGYINNGISSLSRGWIGKSWDNSFMNFLPNGFVGIGLENPTEKLSVNGNIRAKEIKVETNNWPDYVFDEGYEITSLAQLDAYIKTHKHLPDLPSAQEAEANGIALGEMNKILLKKVEELTLYLIEKDAGLTAEKKLNQEQGQHIKSLQLQMQATITRLDQLIKK